MPTTRSGASVARTGSTVLPWLVRLRWAAVAAIAVTAAGVTFADVVLPLVPLGLLLAGLCATNLLLAIQLRSPEPSPTGIGGVLLGDALLLTGILHFAGGPMNPFSTIYLIGVTLAAVLLGHRWALAVALVSVGAYAVTFVWYEPLHFHRPGGMEHELTFHLGGMWVAFTAAALLIAYFVGRMALALEEREGELEKARQEAARTERMAALFSLGAGAAHELATPLGSIRMAAAELERASSHPGATPRDTRPLLAAIQSEVERCTRVLDQMSGRAGAAAAVASSTDLVLLVEDIRQRLAGKLAARLRVELPAATSPVTVPPEPLRQALVVLVQNAFDASGPEQYVTLRIEQAAGLRVEVIDQGRGMTPEMLARAGEPFVTTKTRGTGLGLGLFLARSLTEQIGGTLRIDSTPHVGTTVTLEVAGV